MKKIVYAYIKVINYFVFVLSAMIYETVKL